MKFEKIFTNAERFESEVRFYNRFERLGFDIPKRISVDEERQLVCYEYLQSTREINQKDLLKIIAILAEVYRYREAILLPQLLQPSAVKTKYMAEANIVLGQLNFPPELIRKLMAILDESFEVSVFKDAKCDNWLFTDRILMLDFDYIKPSFLLQDFAQLVTSTALYTGWEMTEQRIINLADHFFDCLCWELTTQEKKNYLISFWVACLYSNFKKIPYRSKYPISQSALLEANAVLVRRLNKLCSYA